MVERILKGAEELFMRLGVKTVTMEEIARHLGVSKKTIYQYYTDKKDLVFKVLQDNLKDREKMLKEIAENAIDPVDEVLKISDFIRASLQNMHPSILIEIQRYFPEAFIRYRQHMDNFVFQLMKANLEKGIQKGLYRKEIDVEVMTLLRLKQIEIAFDYHTFPPSKFSLPDLQVKFIDHFLHGICTLKGHKLINKYKQISEED